MKSSTNYNKNIFEHNPYKTIVFTVLILLSACLLAFEAYLRIFVPLPYIVESFEYHHDLRKNFNGKVRWGETTYQLRTNSLGFKDRRRKDTDLKNTKARHRILLAGDSFTEGVGVIYEKTFAGLLDNYFSKSDTEVFNSGVQSYSPVLYYYKLKYLMEIQGLKFDEVILFADISDIKDELRYLGFRPSKPAALQKIVFFLKSDIMVINYLLKKYGQIQNKIYCKQTADNATTAVQKTGNSNPINMDIVGLELAKANTWRVIKLCLDNKIKITLVIYPHPIDIINNDYNSAYMQQWKEFSELKNVKLINLYPYFFTGAGAEETIKKYFIKDDLHWNEVGHRFVADLLIKELLPAVE
ncbi:MAG: SGNH/GDSL hydrolase family protein [Nitrospirae bacterium YQR-1]